MIVLPNGVKQLTTYEEVQAAWGDLLTVPSDVEGEDGTVFFAGNKRIAITADAIFVHLRRPVKAGENLELTDLLRIEEPTVNAIRQTDKYKGDTDKAAALLSSVCFMPSPEVNRMVASDFALCGEVLSAFLGS